MALNFTLTLPLSDGSQLVFQPDSASGYLVILLNDSKGSTVSATKLTQDQGNKFFRQLNAINQARAADL